jgi:hypothetical protein
MLQLTEVLRLRYFRSSGNGSSQKEWGSSHFAVIQPVGNPVGIITPLATNPVCWYASFTRPFPQGHRMHVDQFAQFSGSQSGIATTKVVNDVHPPYILSLDENANSRAVPPNGSRLHHRCGCNWGCGNLRGLKVAERLLDCRSGFRRIQVSNPEIAHRRLDVFVPQQVLDRLNLRCA